ncbi:transcriptional regulator, partial [Pseudomonas donghuensis]|nr:transcriptional regulator [Pseudomonas donghuensis]
MRIDSIIDFAQVITEAERYRPAAEKILKGEPDQA